MAASITSVPLWCNDQASAPIPTVRVGGSGLPVSASDTVHALVHHTLTYDQRHVDIQLGATVDSSTGNGHKPVEYRIRIQPHHDDWIMVRGRALRVPNLGPGTYTVSAQARYAGMGWGKEVRVLLDVQAEPTPWPVIYGVLGLGIGLTAWSIRSVVQRRQQQRQQQDEQIRMAERRRIARDLHDDVGTGLARIVVLSDAVAAQQGGNPATAAIAETAREVIASVRSIVWVMKSDDDSLTSLLSYMKDKIGEVLGDHGMVFLCDDSLPNNLTLHSAARWNVMMCLKEIATNIVRHSKATHVHMRVSTVNGYLNMQITDNGVGFDHAAVSARGGLTHIRERMTEIGGTAGIGASPNEGTKILLVVPLQRTYGGSVAATTPTQEES